MMDWILGSLEPAEDKWMMVQSMMGGCDAFFWSVVDD